jgi:Ribbon-helix-helix protein, copG family
MPTSVHLPKALLDEVDRKARALQISRNQLVVRALEREVRGSSDWSPDFFDRLLDPGPGVADAVDDLLKVVRGARRSKSPRQF